VTYLARNNEFYSQEHVQQVLYALPHPDREEATRASVILKYLAAIRERYPATACSPLILDVGCGRGWLTAMANLFGHAEGIDPAETPIDYARKYYPELTFRCATLPDLIMNNESERYDVVICSEVFEHIPNLEKQDFANDIGAVLRPNGDCVITTPRRELFRAYRTRKVTLQAIEAWVTEREVRAIFRRSGFQVIAHDRAYAERVGRWGSLYHHPLVRWAVGFRASKGVGRGLEYLASIYQVWWFRKSPEACEQRLMLRQCGDQAVVK
jgi:2-polyprenyl-3-methyl-5-hydroxy-6-metoxy-1,4-benzoquinol methylase